jgi:hypothetical protein
MMKQLVFPLVLTATIAPSTSFSNPQFTPESGQVIGSHVRAVDYFGTGQAFADVNGDGCPDLYVAVGVGANTLFFGDCSGEFVPSTDPAVALATGTSSGVSFADYDNDGDPDLYVTQREGDVLLQNQGDGSFLNVSAASGVGDPGQGQTASWGDYDQDGDLDLYVVNWYYNYLQNSPLTRDGLYRNDSGVLVDVSFLLDETTLRRPGFSASWSDLDLDGDLDLYVVNDKTQGNALWRNDGPGCGGWCFHDVSVESGAFRPASGMGLAIGDYDRDGDFDLYYSGINEAVLLQNRLESGSLEFVEASTSAGVSPEAVGWGAVFVDFDNDGWEDLYLATMNSEPDAANRLYMNRGDGAFDDVSSSSGASHTGETMGVAYADFDLDGWIDLAIGNMDEDYRLFRNMTGATSANNWLRVRLNGGGPVDRDALGSRIVLHTVDGAMMVRELRSGSSLGSGDEAIAHFGLGDSTVQTLCVRWLDGSITRHDAVAGNQTITLVHPRHDEVLRDGFEVLPPPTPVRACDSPS